MKFKMEKFSTKKEIDDWIYDGEPCNYNWLVKNFGDCYEISHIDNYFKVWRFNKKEELLEAFIFTDDTLNNIIKEEFKDHIRDMSRVSFENESYLIPINEIEKYKYKIYPIKLLKEEFPKWKEALDFHEELSKYWKKIKEDKNGEK